MDNRTVKKKAPARKSKPRPQHPLKSEKKKNINLKAYPKKRRTANRTVMGVPGGIALFMIFLVVIAYLVRALFSVFGNPDIATIAVEYGSIDLPTVLHGVIIRDERVYTSTAAGTVYFNYDDLERVKKGAQVCSIQDEAVVSRINDSLADVEAAILELQDRREDISGFSQDAKRVSKQIQDMVDNNRRYAQSNSFASVYTLKENVERNMRIRNNMLLSEDRGSVKDMVARREGYESQLNKSISFIDTQESGVLCYTVDGQEGVLTFETMNALTPERTRIKVDPGALVHEKNVTANDPVFKIVRSNDWYIGVYAPNAFVAEWQEGDSHTVYIEQEGVFNAVDMTVQIINRGEKEDYVLLKSRKNMTDYLNMRDVNLKLSDSGFKGLKIPLTTIVDKTLLKIPNAYVTTADKASVVRRGEELDETIPIAVQSVDDMFTYVFQDLNSALTLGDILVGHDGDAQTYTISEVVNAKGVFVLNNGYADFVKINIRDEMPEKGGYVVLDPELNRGIRVNDKIIYDTKAVVDGQRMQ